jgi:hypothetical protein
VFHRGWRLDDEGKRRAVLLVVPAADHRSRSTLDHFGHECELKDELHDTWAARPLELVREANRTTLVLDDAGGEPLEMLLGVPMDIGRFLRLGSTIASALGKLHYGLCASRAGPEPIHARVLAVDLVPTD